VLKVCVRVCALVTEGKGRRRRNDWVRQLPRNLTFIDPCIANMFSVYNQQDATFHNLFISVRRSSCFRRVFRLAAGSSNGLTNSSRCMCRFDLLLMDRKPRLKHVERLTRINKLRNGASWWLHSENEVPRMWEMRICVCGVLFENLDGARVLCVEERIILKLNFVKWVFKI